MSEPTDAQIDAAYQVIHDKIGLPCMANVKDYIHPDAQGEERREQLDRLKAADQEADRQNRDIVRAILRAALNA